MISSRLPLMAALIAPLVLVACGDGKTKVLTEPDQKPTVSLADIKRQVESNEVRVGVAPAIDAAAKNIDPFKQWDNYRRREVWEDLLVQAREMPDYLERSETLTGESLNELPLSLPLADYFDLIEGAAAVHASALMGARSAHEAQAQASALIDLGIKMGTIRDLEAKLGERVHINSFKTRVAEFEKRNYLNYFLTVDQLMATKTPEEVTAMADQAVAWLPPDWEELQEEKAE